MSLQVDAFESSGTTTTTTTNKKTVATIKDDRGVSDTDDMTLYK